MVKKLDLLIVKAFIGPFIGTFFITLFVLVLQFFWLYIDDVVGKGIDPLTVGQLVMYLSATLVPLALPLAVLLSSIMTLGNLGETFELVAIKSAGISLLRFMRPLLFVSFILTLIAFYFNNVVLPIANLKMNTIKYDIIVTKPAFDIKEGVFYDKIEGFIIKIGKKEKDDSTIREVVIYEQSNSSAQDNMIFANSGKMVVTADKQSLVFTLNDGWRYQEDRGNGNTGGGTQFMRMGFKQYKKVLDLSSFKMNKTNDSTFKNNYQMYNLVKLTRAIDSIKSMNREYARRAATIINQGLKFPRYLDTTGWDKIEQQQKLTSPYLLAQDFARDSVSKAWVKERRSDDSIRKAQDSIQVVWQKSQEAAKKIGDSLAAVAKKAGKPAPPAVALASPPTAKRAPLSKDAPELSLAALLPDSTRITVMDHTISAINAIKVGVDQPALLYSTEQHAITQHMIAWHEKITYAVAVLVMFLIGAPLGSIIRKGGIGLPLVFAVVFFVVFFLLNNFGKKLTSQDILTPVGGIWMSTYVLTPIGFFLIYKALNDSQLFNKEYYYRITRNIKALISRMRKKRVEQAA